MARLTASSLYAKLTVADCTLIQEQENSQSYCPVPAKKLKEHFPKLKYFPFFHADLLYRLQYFCMAKLILSNQQYDGHVHIIVTQSQNTKGLFVCMCMATNEKRPTLKNLRNNVLGFFFYHFSPPSFASFVQSVEALSIVLCFVLASPDRSLISMLMLPFFPFECTDFGAVLCCPSPLEMNGRRS